MARISSPAQISIRGALEAMLTYKVFNMSKPSTDTVYKKKDIFQIVVTPDRIPKFIIPSLEVDHIFVKVNPMEDIKKDLQSQDVVLSPRARRSQSESNIKKAQLLRGRSLQRKISEMEKVVDHSDPPTRAALSLPHLPKITTPYGFLALGESPNIRRKESLFFDPDVSSFSTWPSRPNIPIMKKPADPLDEQKKQKDFSKTPKKPARSLSCETLCCSTTRLPQSGSDHTEGCEKKKVLSFWRKQLSRRRFLDCCRESIEKRHVKVGRTQSNPIT